MDTTRLQTRAGVNIYVNEENVSKMLSIYNITAKTTNERFLTCLSQFHNNYYIENGTFKLKGPGYIPPKMTIVKDDE